MLPPTKSSNNAHGGKGFDESQSLLSNLWVGNLSSEVTDSDLMILFSKYGTVDTITSFPTRSYAFVFFKRVQDAKAALEALHGSYLRGNSLKIHFAKPARPCKSLWVSGISPSVSKEGLEAEFLKFGEIEEFKLLRDRNSAYVDYFRLEDASQALRVTNGRQIGGNQIHVDFFRSQTIRREHWADYRDTREGQFFSGNTGPPDPSWMLQGAFAKYSGSTHPVFKQQHHAQSFGGEKDDEQPSNVLWIGYPPSVRFEEQMLHNALILFGEIERIRSFPYRYYSFVEFRSVDEARRAKEGLQGRLFNDPRISIRYSSSEIIRINEFAGFYSGVEGPRPNVFNGPFFHPPLMDIHNRPIVPNALSGPIVPNALSGPAVCRGILGPNVGRHPHPFNPQGSFEPLLSGPGFNDLTPHKIVDAIPSNTAGGPNWKRSPPVPVMLPSQEQEKKRLIRPVPGACDVFDANQFQRESKISRIDNAPLHDASFPSRKVDDNDTGLARLNVYGPKVDGGVLEKKLSSPAEVRMITRGANQGHLHHDYIWCGVIAKGGTPVCRARCVAHGKGTEFQIPEVVNCSARTGLDVLARHYAEANGCSVVSFLPDNEEDFVPYTEFLRYLGTKDRAGVAKFNDGTILFLVPPSDFLSKVIQIAGPPRLYGVVLKFPQHAHSSPSVQQQFLQSQYPNVQEIPPSNESTVMHQEGEMSMHTKYDRVLCRESLPASKQLATSTKDFIPMHPAPSVNAEAGVSLTPELIATLASLLPSRTDFSDPKTTQPSLEFSSLRPELGSGSGTLPQGWTHDQQGYEMMGHPLYQVENQYNSTGQQFVQLQTYSNGLNNSSNSTVGITGNSQIQNPAFHPPQVAGSSGPVNNFGIPEVTPQVDGQYHYEVHQNAQNGFGMSHGTDRVGSYGSSAYNEPPNRVALQNNQVHGTYVTEAHTATPPLVDKGNSGLSNEVQQLQPALYEASQGTPEFDADKNERYQSTLQFAANLLLKIQQQRQPTNPQAEDGSPNQ